MEWAREMAQECEGQGGAQLASDAASRLAVETIGAVLEGFDAGQLQAVLAAKPDKFIDLIHALSSIRQRDQAAVLLRQKVEDYQRRVRQLTELVDEKGAATKDDVAAIFREAYGVQ